ncbi:penicillin-binding protein activator LpoB [bacterium M00.F.Ca.ET.228.01.1.1]|uniref:penicillin-binding protein activator LpoB n=1 Tax=Paraburkholderia phenoliruptrix TaxID=252970 RepID=UPI001091D798|nr:penicillin-binding protein activator LpoB [Paraburkholderia phenoliruptrix]TGP39512.1 penicillin-binding protein activator LpoB [bacterium M00.F.Ca.ET.228.01.1.1]TGR95243.1 penicillin-binding protein activator LpoB [bacterium M00.F.Ca.ET.191.01.1.1]TGT96073.1 penicillin-binding protein activator LpoB [bacterium M00.F.Ca.ET.155.01.1.1]MBW0446156.1 penicillin-binding protein activator LpoB [Paraburkholderia phenoliruptrix]MBW9096579.1 penicillin-binding protein activator LpoB [Paraburkholderi
MIGVKRLSGVRSCCVVAPAAALIVSACGTIHQSSAPALSREDKVAVVAVANFTETPDAGHSAESIAANALRAGGIADVRIAPADSNRNVMFGATQRADTDKVLEWARSENARYLLSGAVEEWRYKTGVDGEPAVGVTFELIDASNGAVVWSATGTRTGWSRSGLSGVASSLISKVLSPLRVRY